LFLGSLSSLGMAHGGQVVQAARDQHISMVTLLVKLASLQVKTDFVFFCQTCYVTLEEEIKMTSRRVNALDHVIIPRFEGVIHYIEQEMDEMEREEFFRIKKVVQKKREKLIKDHPAPSSAGAPPSVSAAGSNNSFDVGTAFDHLKKDPDLIF
jgi:V-type H+-transporting ATPase subunit D